MDGIEYQTPISFWWNYNSAHTIKAASSIPIIQETNVRKSYVFNKWSDAEDDHERTLIALKPLLKAHYIEKEEFLVIASTTYGRVERVGWYKKVVQRF